MSLFNSFVNILSLKNDILDIQISLLLNICVRFFVCICRHDNLSFVFFATKNDTFSTINIISATISNQ
jgi:hypothetical protein